jgi:stage II sporulation protein D
VFFSNCGGQTANSEDVWNSEVYYLRSVKDSFCLGQNNANWTKKIPKSDWEKYLIAKGFSKEWFEEEECALEYFQCQREKDFEKNNISIPLVDIRKDWKLKSTFFDVEVDGNYVILKGKGFGHGVGMCQEGAMNMAEKGYTYIDILHHYYKGVHMIDLKALDFFKEDF